MLEKKIKHLQFDKVKEKIETLPNRNLVKQKNTMTEIKLYKSPIKSLRLFLLSSLFVIPCAWLIFKGDNSWEFWLALCFFGLGYIVSLFNIID